MGDSGPPLPSLPSSSSVGGLLDDCTMHHPSLLSAVGCYGNRGVTVTAAAAVGGQPPPLLSSSSSSSSFDNDYANYYPSGQVGGYDGPPPPYGDVTVAAATVAAAAPPPLPSEPYPHHGGQTLLGTTVAASVAAFQRYPGGAGVTTVAAAAAEEGVNPPLDMDQYHISESGNVIDLETCGSVRSSIETMNANGGPLWKRFANKAQMPNDDAWECKMNPTSDKVDMFRIRPKYFDDFVTMLKIAPVSSECSNMGASFRQYAKSVHGGTKIPMLGVRYNEPSPQNQFKIGSEDMNNLPWIEFWAEHLLPKQEKKIVSNSEPIIQSLKVGDYLIIRKLKGNRAISADNLPSTMEATIGGRTSKIPVHNIERDTLSRAIKKKKMNLRSVKKAAADEMGIDRKDLHTKQMALVEVTSWKSEGGKDTKAAKRSAPKRTSKKAKTNHEVQYAGHAEGGAPIPMEEREIMCETGGVYKTEEI